MWGNSETNHLWKEIATACHIKNANLGQYWSSDSDLDCSLSSPGLFSRTRQWDSFLRTLIGTRIRERERRVGPGEGWLGHRHDDWLKNSEKAKGAPPESGKRRRHFKFPEWLSRLHLGPRACLGRGEWGMGGGRSPWRVLSLGTP